MKNMKKIISSLLCFVFISVIVSACDGNKKIDGTQSTQSSQATENASWQSPTEGSGGISLPIVKDPVSCTYMFYEVAAMPYKVTWLTLPELEKRTNFKIQPQAIPAEGFQEKANVQILSDDYPELLGGVDLLKVSDSSTEGKFINILEYLDVMPNFKKILEKYPDLKYYQPDAGVMYALPADIWDVAAGRSIPKYSWLVRQDIADKNNLKMPETQEEFYQFLKQLKTMYPDSYPFTTRNKLDVLLQQMGDAWGLTIVNEDTVYDRTTETFSWVGDNERYRKMFEFIDKLYKEGLLDSEFLIPNVTQWQEKMLSGKSFFTIDWMTRADKFNSSAKELGNNEYNLVSMLPPEFEGGERLISPKKRANANIVVSSKVKNPEEYLKMLDYWLYSKDGAILSYMGVEGKTFKWKNDEKTQWEIISDGEFSNPLPSDYTIKYGLAIDVMSGVKPEAFGIEELKFDDQYQKDVELYKGHYTLPEPIMLWSAEETDFMWEMDPVRTKRVDMMSQVLIGAQNMSDWDSYISDARKQNIDKMIKTYNDNWTRRK